jgi:L-aminopeptidase/D-esterase-like protein
MALGIDDLAVGHWADPQGLTGCTVLIPPAGNVTSCSVRGGGPGTRETDLLHPQAHLESVSAVLLTGGSAFGLAAAHGVVGWCERAGIGYDRFGGPIPIVPAAVLFDLAVGDWNARPGPAEGEAACAAASTVDGPMGNVGAGMGATVGKIAGPENMMKGGLGYAVRAVGQVTVGAIVAVNAGGDILDEDGSVLAGARVPGGGRAALRERLAEPATAGEAVLPEPVPPGGSTTLGAVVTNARLSKSEAYRVAVQAHDGMARAILPVHTTYDGDTVFAISVPRVGANTDLVAVLAEEALAEAIRAGVRAAATLAGIPGVRGEPGPGPA